MKLSEALIRAEEGWGIFSPHPALSGVTFTVQNGAIQAEAAINLAKAGRYETRSRTEPGLPASIEILNGEWYVCDKTGVTLADVFPEIGS